MILTILFYIIFISCPYLQEKEELAASLTAAQAEAEAARLRAAAAEEARRAAEEVARTMAIPVEPIVPEKVKFCCHTYIYYMYND